MLTDGEIQATSSALEDAGAAADAAEKTAGKYGNRNALGWLLGFVWSGPTPLDDARSTDGLIAASTTRDLVNALQQAQFAAIASDTPDHEQAIEIVQMASRISNAGIASTIEAHDNLAASTVKSIKDEANSLYQALKPYIPDVPTWWSRIKTTWVIIAVVAGLLILLYGRKIYKEGTA